MNIIDEMKNDILNGEELQYDYEIDGVSVTVLMDYSDNEAVMDIYADLLHDITYRHSALKVHESRIGFTATMGSTTYIVNVTDADDGDGLASAITKQLNEIGFL